MKRGPVTAPRNLDDDGIGRSGAGVIPFERAPQPSRFGAHDRIVLRVEIRTAPERLHGDRISLDAFGFAAQCRLYDEAQECDQLRGMPEDLASRYFVERGPDFAGRRLVFARQGKHSISASFPYEKP